MARRTVTTAAALAATAALLLTACGGGDDSSSDDIKGADKGSGSPSASASSSGSSKVERPEITIPSSFKLTFESWTSSDSKEQAVLDDAKEELRAGYAAIIANDPDSEALAFYDTETGLPQSKKWIKSYTDKNVTVIGELPAFDPKVTLVDSGDGRTASLRYCTDESKAYTKNRKTGKEVGNPAGTDPEVVYVVTLRESAQGVWQNASVTSKRGGCTK
ncbi:hypothetical protein [Streptomyces liliifuscus]|uniref:Lipoprotein n=1 Tax=Streptomyces liliifuscus TaxID=2797636 RepID=A0A7T7I820_9ACTN|nr:hypothetical protein [Streptomyces liliifuscus]QQM42721.1 hypothetical protein JEQ17_27055 [Streptomyces liliifuscus]